MAVDCIKLIREFTQLSDREAGEVLRELRQEVARRGGPTDPELVAKIAQEKKESVARKAVANERATKIQALKLVDAVTQADAYKGTKFGSQRYNAGKSFLVGSNQRVEGARASVERHSLAIQSEVYQDFLTRTESGHDGILKRLDNDEGFNLKVAQELYADTAGQTTVKTVTGDKDAFHLASTFDQSKEKVRMMANQEGADIDRLPGHVTAQVHNPRTIAQAGYEKWRDTILSRLDLQKTFGGQDADKVLKTIYGKIENDRYNVFTADHQGSLGQRMSSKRFLVFKSAEDWLAYNKEFGTGSNFIGAAIQKGLLDRAAEVGIMQRMGADPDAFLERYVKTLAKTDPNEPKGRLTEAEAGKLRNQYAAIAKYDRAPANVNWAATMQGIRTVLNTSKLGGAMLSSFNDLATAASTARYNGQGYLDAYANMLKGMPKDNVQFVRFVDSFAEGTMADIANRMGAEDGSIGLLSKMSNTFFKLNGLRWWTDRMKAGFAWTMSNHLGEHLKFAWDSIPAEMRQNLSRYGFDADDWAKMRTMGGDTHNGKRFITPDMLTDVDVSRKLRTWLMSEAEFAVPTPGAGERAFALQGTRPGTLPGEFLRFFWQFKMFTLSTMMKTWPRTVEMGVPGAVHLALMSSIFGYLSMSAKDMLSGKAPADPSSAKTIASALATSGGMGVLGDLLFSDFTASGRSLPEVAAGPAVGVLGDAARIYSMMKKAEFEDGAARAFSTTVHNLPYANLFYGRAAINYLFMYHAQEWLNPGYLQRMESRVKSETGQSYWLRPGDYVNYGGGFK